MTTSNNVPQLWVVAGPNGAGKTTLVTQRLEKRAIDDTLVVINPDTIAQNLPLVDGRLDERKAGEAALGQRTQLIADRRNLAIETTLSGHSALRFMRAALAANYSITLVYVGVDSAELSLERVRSRVEDGGHAVPLDAIRRRHPDSLAKLPEALQLSNRAYVFDNSARKRRLLMIRESGMVRYLIPDAPEWFRGAVPLDMRRWPQGRQWRGLSGNEPDRA